ncbi:MAG TPA: DUF6194 family protein [Thermomicrobiales bacterium]|nr:DUF6194 family protein [Thermomicrobiales bacterium]
MDPDTITRYIVETFANVDVVVASGDSFFFYNPPEDQPPDRRFPFATLVTGDQHDQASNLRQPGVFRLNIGVSPETFRSLFGQQPAADSEPTGLETPGYDFTALDRIMPHPVYGRMFWACVLNPSDATFDTARPLLAEAYDRAVKRHATTRRAGRV